MSDIDALVVNFQSDWKIETVWNEKKIKANMT